MKTNKCSSLIAFVAALVAMTFALPGRMPGQTTSARSDSKSEKSATHWSVQIEQVDSGNLELAYSFQIAIYENLVDELKKAKQFSQVFRDGDLKASEVPNLLMIILEPSRRFFETQKFFYALEKSGMSRREVRVGPVLASTIYFFDSSTPQTPGPEEWTVSQLRRLPSALETNTQKPDFANMNTVVGFLRSPWRSK